MTSRRGRRWLPIALACLLLAGIFVPVVAFGQASGSQEQGQLAALVSAAGGSKSYATGVVSAAASSGLSVAAAENELNQGNSLLASAQADLQAGTDTAAGIQAVQAAMSDYAAAAAGASVALGSAGLTASVDYSAAVSAVADVNATVDVIETVAVQACAGAAASNAQAFTQGCTQVEAQVASAVTDLSQAASLLIESNGQVATSADVSQALSLVAQARASVAACQSELLTLASFTYAQRGQAYISSVLDPLYANANATVRAEQSVLANVTTYQASWSAYAQSQASAAAQVSSAASSLGTAIAQVDTSSVSSSITSAQSVEGQVSTEMSDLLAITVLGTLYPAVVTDINACVSAGAAYNSALGSAQTWSGAYSQTTLSGFSTYLNTGASDAAIVKAHGNSYISAYNTVVSDLYPLLGVPGIQPIYNTLTGLQVSASAAGANSALSQETGALSTVEADISSLSSAIVSAQSAVSVSAALLANAATVSSEGSAYLNSTARAVLAQISTSAQSTSQAAASFVTSAQACLQTTVGGYAGTLASLGSAGSSLSVQSSASAGAAATAASYVQTDSEARAGMTAAGSADLSQALQLFTGQNISGGVNALLQASLEFQAASATSA